VALDLVEEIRQYRHRADPGRLYRHILKICVRGIRESATVEDRKKTSELLLREAGALDPMLGRKFSDYLLEFWDRERSPYIKDLAANGRILSRHYTDCVMARVRLHAGFFGDMAIAEITAPVIEEFKKYLMQQKTRQGNPYSAKTIRSILSSVSIPLGELARLGAIAHNPAQRIRGVSGSQEVRNPFPAELARQLLADPEAWDDRRAYLVNLAAATSGARLGEILALTADKLQGDRILLDRSFTHHGRTLKSTKTGRPREAFLAPEIREQLLDLARENPWGNGFVFWGDSPRTPLDPNYIRKKLYARLAELGVDDAERRRQGLVFHSWRHLYNSILDGAISREKRMLLIGHTTAEMADKNYLHLTADDEAAILKAQRRFLETA